MCNFRVYDVWVGSAREGVIEAEAALAVGNLIIFAMKWRQDMETLMYLIQLMEAGAGWRWVPWHTQRAAERQPHAAQPFLCSACM